MVVAHRTHLDQAPPIAHDEGWWQSVLADEERFAVTAPAKPATPRPKPQRPPQPQAPVPVAVQPPKPAPQIEVDATLSTENWKLATEVYKQDQIVSLAVDWQKLGYRSARITVPSIKDFQEQRSFASLERVTIPAGKGFLIVLDRK